MKAWQLDRLGGTLILRDINRPEPLLDLLRSGLLDITPIGVRTFSLEWLPEAMEAATAAGNLECVVMTPNG